jgi:hypothetical protein
LRGSPVSDAGRVAPSLANIIYIPHPSPSLVVETDVSVSEYRTFELEDMRKVFHIKKTGKKYNVLMDSTVWIDTSLILYQHFHQSKMVYDLRREECIGNMVFGDPSWLSAHPQSRQDIFQDYDFILCAKEFECDWYGDISAMHSDNLSLARGLVQLDLPPIPLDSNLQDNLRNNVIWYTVDPKRKEL